MKGPAILAACVLLVSCATLPPASPVADVPLADPSPFTITLSNQLRGADRATVTEIVNATLEVIRSDTFAKRLASVSHEVLWLSPTEGTLPPREVMDIYMGRHASMRPLPTTITLSRGLFGPKTPVTDLDDDPAPSATITLTKWELRRWRSGTPEGRSCAVNTLAHEITHTVSTNPDSARYLFMDQGRAGATRAGRPLVSYVVGSVAQCTMLENQGALDTSFADCVNKWGTNVFESDDCE